ncbi:LacI family DNA-binding transcriptional regulator [Phycicoccus sonneratiae]|uniref:LacI family DNA-binding transcriptional regulator n=1 Tax=Phycicoccus sonneratiae TaxID=2807628 RepID=A0ABS2CHD0_9MICO|nr:LacI family DNA-binding transcriptional regulator [Phycicoccus sonneraticus]MBM6399277.1 LacI family DNA-binding transcriptional regulator [Phycicoccus sonneraticus]
MTAHPPGSGGTTIYSVADAAGVSIATVSRVLQGSSAVSERTRGKVLEAIDRLDYMPVAAARSLAVRQHEALGLVLPELGGPYFSELLMGFEEAAAALDLSVVLALVEDDRPLDGPRVTRLAAGVDGVAVLGGLLSEDVLRRASRHKPVLVLAGRASDGIEHFAAENTASAAELTAHLLDDHGRTRPVFAGLPDVAPDVRARFEGFAAALAERGLAVPEPLGGGLRESDGAALAEQLLAAGPLPDAVVCANDEIALALVERLTAAGVRVPDDLAVTGWDDVMAARYVRPGLTTVRQPVRELGALAARRLHERVTGAEPGDPGVLATRVVVRGSCGCPEPSRTVSP